MISTENKGLNSSTADDDFTVEHYRQLLQLAIKNYEVTRYADIPWGKRFVLWRHDLDNSLNRGLALAKIETEKGVKATYFINPHSEFYNIAEVAQHKIVQEILSLGHDLGLHFDAAFYDIKLEQEVDRLITQEADYLYTLFGVKPAAFSFHNPVATYLSCEADYYGGLVNCYSKRFKEEVPYCSDSNGYWRYRRLYDVLAEGKYPCLQVLTHPGWWQDKPMPPRQRIFRSAYGRAAATLHRYDDGLESHGRLNHAGAAEALAVLKQPQPQRYELCDYLWNQGHYQALFTELWRLHETQINRLCKAVFRKEWQVPAVEVNAFFGEDSLRVDGWKLFSAVFETSWTDVAEIDEGNYRRWVKMRNQIIHGRSSAPSVTIEEGCVMLCSLMQRLAEWGKGQPIVYDGLAHLGSIGLPTVKTADGSLSECLEEVKGFPRRKWKLFKLNLLTDDQSG